MRFCLVGRRYRPRSSRRIPRTDDLGLPRAAPARGGLLCAIVDSRCRCTTVSRICKNAMDTCRTREGIRRSRHCNRTRKGQPLLFCCPPRARRLRRCLHREHRLFYFSVFGTSQIASARTRPLLRTARLACSGLTAHHNGSALRRAVESNSSPRSALTIKLYVTARAAASDHAGC